MPFFLFFFFLLAACSSLPSDAPHDASATVDEEPHISSPPSSLSTHSPYSVIAVVNDSVISKYDLTMREKLFRSTTPPVVLKRYKASLKQVVLDTLIMERLQLKEADRLGITASDDEINRALQTLEKRHGMRSGDMKKMMQHVGVPFRVLQEQVKADLLWVKVVQQELMRSVYIQDKDILLALGLNPSVDTLDGVDPRQLEKVRLALINERAGLLAERYLQELHDYAVIDIKEDAL